MLKDIKGLLTAFLTLFFLGFGLAAGVTYVYRVTKNFQPITLPKEIDLPEVRISAGDTEPEETMPPETTPSAKLKVTSATLVGLFEEEKLKGVRILGEVKNIGSQVATEPTPVFRLFDAENNFLASKRGEWTVPDVFQTLPIGEETFYDTYLNVSPDSFNSIEITFNTKSVADNPSPRLEALKIQNRKIEQKEAVTSQASPSSEELAKSFKYFQFSGTLINLGDTSISDLAVLVWVKDSENKILAAEYVSYPQDILTADQEIPILFNLLPLREGEMVDYRVEIYGRNLE